MDDRNDTPAMLLAGELTQELEQLLARPLEDQVRQGLLSALEKARALSDRLQGPRAETIDRSVFDTLMEIAGPDTANQLLDQVEQDLLAIEQALAHALPRLDWQALRAQSHVLLSVSGSLGAMQLYRQSGALNEAVHAQDAKSLGQQHRPLLAAINDLLDFVRKTAANRRAAQPAPPGAAAEKAI